MADKFRDSTASLTSVTSLEYETITPSDSTDLKFTCKEIHLGVGGNLSVIDTNGVTVTLVGLTAGRHPYAANRIRATGTTASNITVAY